MSLSALTSLFLCVANPPDLHSFPTRRSSDLDPGELDDLRAGPAEHQGVAQDGLGAEVVVVDAGVDALAGQDRKSTRLNSSHSQISYAVFCLKKKNKVVVSRDATDARILPLRV